MADEPRRSGRATKGHHSKNAEDDSPPPPKRGSSKGKGKNAKDEPDEPEEEEEEAIIRCVCGTTEDEDGWPMICCDKCEAWQHNLCMDISENDDELPDKYFCELCRPADHKPLLAAMKKGEKPWEVRIAQRRKEEEEASKKRKGKGKRKSGASVARDTPVKASPVPKPDPSNKRKFDDVHVEIITKRESPPAVATPVLARRNTQPINDAKRRKSSAAVPDLEIATSIDALPADRKKAAAALSSKVKQVIGTLVKASSYRIPDGQTGASLGDTVALQIEHALMSFYGNPTAYAEQFRTIIFNVPKNPQLVTELLAGELTGSELANMSADDMATEDLQKHRATARAEADKQAILITEPAGPRVRKTHKGDEIIGGEELPRADDDATWAPARHRENTDDTTADGDDAPGSPQDMPELPEDSTRPSLAIDTTGASTTQGRKASNFSLNRAWQSAHSPDHAHSVRGPRTQPAPAQSLAVQVPDADIDRLLKDEDSDTPMSPAGAGAASSVWDGKIDMAGVASFVASARWVAGGDVGQKIPYPDLLPPTVEITGRIPFDRADKYVADLRFSSTTDVCCLALSPKTANDRDAFKKVFNYFHSRSKWGVAISDATGMHEALKDLYVIPLKAGESTYPGFMKWLEERQIEEPRTQDMLILNIVVKSKSPTGTPQIPQPSTPTIPTGAPHPSPVVHQSNGFPATPTIGTTPPPAPALAQQGAPQSDYAWATPLVTRILGAHTYQPAVIQLFSAVPTLTEEQLTNLKVAMETEPSTRHNLTQLAAWLQKSQQAAQ